MPPGYENVAGSSNQHQDACSAPVLTRTVANTSAQAPYTPMNMPTHPPGVPSGPPQPFHAPPPIHNYPPSLQPPPTGQYQLQQPPGGMYEVGTGVWH